MQQPFWSIMIPTYNCASFLVKTLESVMAQYAFLENRVQIEVVDDGSTKDDPEVVVQQIGGGKVNFYRQPQNVGAIRNFNTCIERAKGKYVHILHGDDYVAADFYKEYEHVIQQYPTIGLITSDSIVIDGADNVIEYSQPVTAFHTPTKDVSGILYLNPFRTPGVVVSKDAYNALGLFEETLVHCADWEMWVRVIHKFGGVHISKPLNYYREHGSNDTSKLTRTGEKILDHERTFNMFLQKGYPVKPKEYIAILKRMSKDQYQRFKDLGDAEAAASNRKVFFKYLNVFQRIKYNLKGF